MGVCAIRIDERLIHGQVATLWQGSWNCNRIMVIDTKSANDPMLKSVLKIACPTGVRLSVLEPDTAAANLQSGKYGKERITIVCGSSTRATTWKVTSRWATCRAVPAKRRSASTSR